MVEVPAHPAGATQADVEPDPQPATTSDPAPAAEGPFTTGRRSRAGIEWPVLAVIFSAGGVAGALARYGLTEAFPHAARGFAWATFGINVSGCLLIGVFMVVVSEVRSTRRLLGPFVGTGMLGGYTTFSTYIVDIHQLLAAGAARAALAYLAGTLVAALGAVYAGIIVTRWAVRRLHHHKEEAR